MRHDLRIRLLDDGRIEIVDPGFDELPLLQQIAPDFRLRTATIPGFESPRLQRCRLTALGKSRDRLAGMSTAELWQVHAAGRRAPVRSQGARDDRASAEAATWMDVKVALACRLLEDCVLCAHRCGVDRTSSERGACGLGGEARVADAFVHVAEEAPINPSLVLNLTGCGLRCRFCQQWKLLNPRVRRSLRLDPGLWPTLDFSHTRSLSFVGGNPDESLAACLAFLHAAPREFDLPIVWNCHGYASDEALDLLDGVVDVYVPDLKFGNDECARRLAGIDHYVPTVLRAMETMLRQGCAVIVRLLVLPGHVECCHLPAIASLKSLARGNLLVSVRGQYSPDWKISVSDGAMARRCSVEELSATQSAVAAARLNMVDA